MCETVREKWLNKIPIILLLFSNFQATWSDGEEMENKGEERGIVSEFFAVGDVAECLMKKKKVKIRGF